MGFDPLSALADLGKSLVDRLIPDPKARAEANQKLLEMQQSGELAKMAQDSQIMQAQADINKIEAASPNLFIAGWRPAIGWICGGALAVSLVLGPLAMMFATMFGHPFKMVELDTSLLSTLLISMLGIGTLRTAEKISNAEKNR